MCHSKNGAKQPLQLGTFNPGRDGSIAKTSLKMHHHPMRDKKRKERQAGQQEGGQSRAH
jgi:hypothetical protein